MLAQFKYKTIKEFIELSNANDLEPLIHVIPAALDPNHGVVFPPTVDQSHLVILKVKPSATKDGIHFDDESKMIHFESRFQGQSIKIFVGIDSVVVVSNDVGNLVFQGMLENEGDEVKEVEETPKKKSSHLKLVD